MSTDTDLDWDTDEVLNWFLNDEYMYNNRFGSVDQLRELWLECDPNSYVDIGVVDWYYVEEFLSDS